jgi:hypothetical protein
MSILSHKKHFTIHHANPNKHFTLCIALDGEVVHHIQSFKAFIKHLGYSDILPTALEEKNDFGDIKTESIKNHKIKVAESIDLASETCLQYKIAEYLYKNNDKFRNECNDYYKSLWGTCKSLKLINSEKCNKCIMLKK